MKTPAQLQFQEALASAYANLFITDPNYAYSASNCTPESLAEKMTDAAIRGSANVTGRGFAMACRAVGIPHTSKAIGAFLGRIGPTNANASRKSSRAVMLAASGIEAIMSGACAAFASGDSVTIKYSDGSSESADCPEQAEMIRNYAKDSRCETPNFFSIVSAVQSKRQTATT